MTDNETLMDLTFPDSLPFSPKREPYVHFLENGCANSSARTIVISFPVPWGDPLTWLKIFKNDRFSYYWEKPNSSTAIAACGVTEEYTASGQNRFETINNKIQKSKDSILHLNLSTGAQNCETYFVGGFSFFDELNDKAWESFAPASFTLPEFLIRKENSQTVASIAIKRDENHTLEELHRDITQKMNLLFSGKNQNGENFPMQAPVSSNGEHISNGIHEHRNWVETITDAREKINKGIFKKVVIGRQLKLQLPQSYDPFQVLNRLRERYPKCTTFYLKKENSGAFIGSSPELLLSINNKKVQTEALAGSIARGNSKSEDRKLVSTLLESEKDKQEHEIVVAHIKKLLSPFVENLKSNYKPEVKKLANVQHLQTPIEGHMLAPVSAFSILNDLHPTPAVGGTPPEKALPYIAKNELFDRGWFAGPVGWVTSEKNAEFSVAIRSGLINNNSARLFAGCGIVANSDPETEWQETNLKFIPMLSALNYD